LTASRAQCFVHVRRAPHPRFTYTGTKRALSYPREFVSYKKTVTSEAAIAELTPQLVTFNGNSFDLPVLRYSAMINEGSAPGLSVRPYFNRYTEDALDLCDVLSSFAPHTKASLNELSRIMGMPGKPDDIDGSQVHQFFIEGRIKEIADYCETDLVNTYRVWLRYELFRGRSDERGFKASELNLIEFIRRHENTKQHLSGVVAKAP